MVFIKWYGEYIFWKLYFWYWNINKIWVDVYVESFVLKVYKFIFFIIVLVVLNVLIFLLWKLVMIGVLFLRIVIFSG